MDAESATRSAREILKSARSGEHASEAAVRFTRRGWSVIPIPHESKNPGLKGWQLLRLGEGDLPQHFNGHPQNIGVLLGEPSEWLIDIDLDHPRAIELAADYLPPTPLRFGRSSKPESHWIYRVTGPVATKKHCSKSAGMIVELRSTGAQTVFPPSAHESGEAIKFVDPAAEPALVEPDELLEAVGRLAAEVRIRLGERAAPKPPKRSAKRRAQQSQSGAPTRLTGIARCLEAMLRMDMADANDGSSRLFAAACRAVEHNLSDADAVLAIRDYARQRSFPTEWTDDQILDRIRDAEAKTQRGVIRCGPDDQGRPSILIDTDEHRVVAETVQALAADSATFQRGGMLVRIVREPETESDVRRPGGTPVISALPPASLRERMTKHAGFTKFSRKGDVLIEASSHPTQWLVNAVHARADWPGVRYLAGVSDSPVLRPDGSIWQTCGYDTQSGALYEPEQEFPQIADELDDGAVQKACNELLEVVCDFRFESEDHRAAWLAGLLTPLARYAFTGPSPLFLIDANVRGAGKGLLAQTIGEIVLGAEMPVSSYSHDPDEMRKKITAIALAGDRLVNLDNLQGVLGNDALDRALTSTRWKDRLLGKSEQVDLPLHAVWYGTGNNVSVGDDTTRRIIHIRLDVLEERPEERSGFRHPDLLGWLQENRPRLVAAALTILAGYLREGSPHQDLPPFGSFTGWSQVVRQAVVWAGFPDPCRTRVQLAERANSSADALCQFVNALRQYDPSANGVVVSDLIRQLYPAGAEHPVCEPACTAMRAALENLVGCPPGKTPGARQVGNRLKHFRRRVVNGHYLDTNPNEHHRNGAIWRVYPTNSGDDL